MTRTPRILTASDPSVSAAPQAAEAVEVESDLVVILAALLCALICVVGLIAVGRCAWLRRGNGGSSNSGNRSGSGVQGSAHKHKGLKKKVLQSLPTFTYTYSSSSDVAECAICLGEFAEGEEIRALPQCRHAFHVACIDTWLGSHSSCPSCRQILVLPKCHRCAHFPPAGGAEAQLNHSRVSINNPSHSNNNYSVPAFLP